MGNDIQCKLFIKKRIIFLRTIYYPIGLAVKTLENALVIDYCCFNQMESDMPLYVVGHELSCCMLVVNFA